MSSRGHRPSTTPMDFEWSNQSGPIDPNSPFLASQQQAKKRPHSVLDSPSRNGFSTPQRLREPDNRPFFFSQDPASTSKPLPLPPHVQNAWEPRTPASTYDASSGGETPNTPQVDSDAATPDTQMATKFGRLGTNDLKKGGRRDSWWRRMLSSPSPTKERERERDKDTTSSSKYYSKKAENRIAKRRTERSERSRSKKRAAPHDDESSDSDQAGKPVAAVKQTFAMSIAGVLSWIEAHPNLPSVLSYYLQLAVNASLGFLFLYIVYSAWSGVMADIEVETDKHVSEVMIEISSCAKAYNLNRCRPEEVVPAMESACGVWETCMNRDPRKVARASVTAKTFAMIFNSFVEEFSYKSMIFSFLLIFGGFNLSNWAFGLLRSSSSHNAHSGNHQNAIFNNQQQHGGHNANDFHHHPQTPHRVPSNNYLEYSQGGGGGGMGGNWGNQTPYNSMRLEGPPPPLMHSQSMPAIPLLEGGGGGGGGGNASGQVDDGVSVRRSSRKKGGGVFR